MEPYSPRDIEPKWQRVWADTSLYAAVDADKTRPKYYVLTEFPYPSGDGLHAGHTREYTIGDVIARFHRMRGYNVLYPMGWDAFGLPAENYAIKNKVHPSAAVAKNVANFKAQMIALGLGFDWDREINTTDPNYYKWTQWLFLQFLKHDLAYQDEIAINWCPKEKTGLANEEVVNGLHERCGTPVEKKLLKQWMLKITAYADRLVDGLKTIDFPPRIADQQINWIGRSEGAEIDFVVTSDKTKPRTYVLVHGFQGRPSDYDWLKGKLEKQGHRVIVPTLPHADAPQEEEWVKAVVEATNYDESTTVLGYSLGAITALKAIERLPAHTKLARLVLAAGFIDPQFADTPRNFEATFKWEIDAAAIKQRVTSIELLHDTTDTAVTDGQAERLSVVLGVPVTRVAAQAPHFTGKLESTILHALDAAPIITVYTTRTDTLAGATFLVLAPEHPAVAKITTEAQRPAVDDYVKAAQSETELQRQEEQRPKTGVFTGAYAENPITKAKMPVWVADYVLAGYGTGAIMAVPAHDDRDFAFAKVHKLPVSYVIEPQFTHAAKAPHPDLPFEDRQTALVILKHPTEDKYLLEKLNGWDGETFSFPMGGIDPDEDAITAGLRELKEETGYHDTTNARIVGGKYTAQFFHDYKRVNRRAHITVVVAQLKSLDQVKISDEERKLHELHWLSGADILTKVEGEGIRRWFEALLSGGIAFSGEGPLANSGQFDGLSGDEAKHAIIAWLFDQGIGRHATKYRLRDWIFSRQHYWGEPIPVIHCPKDGIVPVPDDQLPVTLPEVERYEPTDTGESPLAAITDWVNVACPKCGAPAKRETDTMPNWAGSSWYWLRYLDPHNHAAFADPDKLAYWGMVDLYLGGMEHTTLHLLYSRFWHQFLYDQKLVPLPEPYAARRGQGIVLAADGRKMSKSLGNVINPTDIIARYGADAFRLYIMFMAPYDETTPWSDERLNGVSRFLYRAWGLAQELIANNAPSGEPDGILTTVVDRQTNKTLKKVTDDLGGMRFNTMVSTLMELVNFLNDAKVKSELVKANNADLAQRTARSLILMLAPSVPHIAEQLWHELGEQGSVHIAPWPAYDPQAIKDDVVTVVVQVAGKVRGEIAVAPDTSEAEIINRAATESKAAAYLEGKTILKTIVVPRKLVNFVVK